MAALTQFVYDKEKWDSWQNVRWYFYMGRTMYLLLSAEKTGQVICIQVIFEVAVSEHEEVQIPASGHHLVERTELLEAQGSLVVIGICLLHKRSRHVCFHFSVVSQSYSHLSVHWGLLQHVNTAPYLLLNEQSDTSILIRFLTIGLIFNIT